MLLPLVAQPSQRGTDDALDARLVNGYIEKDASGNVMVCKRGGFFRPSYFGALTQPVRAVWTSDAVDFYIAANSRLVRLSAGVFSDLGGIVGGFPTSFNENLASPRQLFVKDLASAYYFNKPAGPATLIGGAFPVTTVPGSAFLDGTLYVMGTDGVIYGSAINDLATWSALNTIVPQIEPDPPRALAKQLIYVVAFKAWSTEFFYDAGNPTGSPLLPIQNAKLSIGCAQPSSIQDINGDLYFVATDRGQRQQVARMSGLKVAFISTPEINRYVGQDVSGNTTSWQCTFAGHTFYCLNIGSVTLAYDVDAGVWSIWQLASGAQIPVVDSAGWLNASTKTLLLTTAGDGVYGVSPTVYADNFGSAAAINFEVVTPNFDGDTRNIKVLSKMRFMCDQNSVGTLEVCWSDDDYKTWSSWVSVNLQDEQPQLTDLGSFYKRAFWFRSSSPGPLRIRAIDLDLLVGSA